VGTDEAQGAREKIAFMLSGATIVLGVKPKTKE
jgi:hypothetical protein